MHGRSIASLPVAVAIVAVLLSVATRAGAADPTAFAVNSTVDAVDASPGDGICATAGSQCTLRAAIQEANALPGPDVIVLPSGTYTLTVAGGQVASDGLDISDDLEIRGAGAATTVIDANHLGRVLQALSGTSIVSSVALEGAGPVVSGCGPGGVFNQGNLTLNDAIINENSGAGIINVGTLTVNRSTISSNGGCIQGGLGGGLVSFGTATLTNVTVSGNADIGGGGGILVDTPSASATLVNVTVSDNFGGGISAGGPVTLKNTIIANNSRGNCGGNIASDGHNLEDGDTCGFTAPGDLVNTDPQLGPLADNGGPTQTHALLAGSPAIDAGSLDCPPPETDQRGVARPVDGDGDGRAVCDMGAYEFQPPQATSSPTPLPLPTSTPAPTATRVPMRLPTSGGSPPGGESLPLVLAAIGAGLVIGGATAAFLARRRRA